jgi:hypothetical protein
MAACNQFTPSASIGAHGHSAPVVNLTRFRRPDGRRLLPQECADLRLLWRMRSTSFICISVAI